MRYVAEPSSAANATSSRLTARACLATESVTRTSRTGTRTEPDPPVPVRREPDLLERVADRVAVRRSGEHLARRLSLLFGLRTEVHGDRAPREIVHREHRAARCVV